MERDGEREGQAVVEKIMKGDRTTFLPLCPLKKARSPHWGAPG